MMLKFLFIIGVINNLSTAKDNLRESACQPQIYTLVSGAPLYIQEPHVCLLFYMSAKYNTTIDVELISDVNNYYVLVYEYSGGVEVSKTQIFFYKVDEFYKFSYNISFPSTDSLHFFLYVKKVFFYINAIKKPIKESNDKELNETKKKNNEKLNEAKEKIDEKIENLKKKMKIIFAILFFILIIICFFIILTVCNYFKKNNLK